LASRVAASSCAGVSCARASVALAALAASTAPEKTAAANRVRRAGRREWDRVMTILEKEKEQRLLRD
jgi:hypothetical protein